MRAELIILQVILAANQAECLRLDDGTPSARFGFGAYRAVAFDRACTRINLGLKTNFSTVAAPYTSSSLEPPVS